MKAKKKILISGLLGAKGGRELEAAFIAQTLENEYDVTLMSTVNVHPDSDVYAFQFQGHVDSLNMLLYRTNFWIRFTTDLMYAFRKKIRANHFHVSNRLTRFLLDIDAIKNRTISNYIKSFDAVIICAQLHSQQMASLVLSAHEEHIPTIFRTTGSIDLAAVHHPAWLERVTHFIHHSDENASHLNLLKNHKFAIIDQCAFQESALLKVPLVTEKATRFLCLGRLDKNKNIDSVIRAFQNLLNQNITLTIVGSGPENKRLEELASLDNRIHLKPAIKYADIVQCYSNHDCLIIASRQESGPLTAIEAMAAGRAVISTKVGAMRERLPGHSYFVDGSARDIAQKMNLLMNLNTSEVEGISTEMRTIYRERFERKTIANKYLTLVQSIV